MEIIASQVTVEITIGGGLSIALDQRNNLLVHSHKHGTSINLGPLTQQRAREIGTYLNRLAIHVPEK